MTSVTRSFGVGGVMLHGKYATVPATDSTLVVITEKKNKKGKHYSRIQKFHNICKTIAAMTSIRHRTERKNTF